MTLEDFGWKKTSPEVKYPNSDTKLIFENIKDGFTISITFGELVGMVPPNARNDDFLISVAAILDSYREKNNSPLKQYYETFFDNF